MLELRGKVRRSLSPDTSHKPVKTIQEVPNVLLRLLHTSEVQKRQLAKIDLICGIRSKIETY